MTTTPSCTCGADALHTITCAVVAAQQPHAMTNDAGEVFYPDNPEDARLFAAGHDARPLNPDQFPTGWLLP